MNKLTLILALSAAFVGGAVLADTDAPTVVRAQSFALVDANGKTVGVFGVEKGAMNQGMRTPTIALYDSQGRVIWRAAESAQPIATAQ